MASYGTPSAGKTLSASSTSDTIKLAYGQTAEQSSTNIYGLAGNDVISLAAVAESAKGSANALATVTLDAHYLSGMTGGITASASTVLSGSIDGLSAIYHFSSTTTGKSDGNDSGGTSFTVDGSASTSVYLTSTRGVRYITNSTFDAAAGNDAIYLGDQVIAMSASTLAGGDGDDTIGFYTYNDNSAASSTNTTAATINGVFFDGGAGNDKIDLEHDAGGVLKSTTVQGGQGVDTIGLSADASVTASSVYILGGGGNDAISAHLDGVFLGSTVAGGGGADTIVVDVAGTASAAVVLGDAMNNIDSYDGGDTITFSAAAANGVTIQGMGGNDKITADVAAAGGVLIQTNVGDDSVYFSGDFDSSQIQLGAGADLLSFSGEFATDVNSAYIYGGGGNDTIQFFGDIASGGGFHLGTAATVFGGAGADVFSADNADATGVAFTFGYSAASDSTLSAMDTIAFGGASTEGIIRFNYLPGSTEEASFSATKASSTNGIVTFTSTYNEDVTARAQYVDSQTTTAGAAAVFVDGAGLHYLFVQGGDDDLVVQLTDAANSKTFTISASTAVIGVTISAE